VVTIQKRMQNRPPALLSTSVFKNESYIMQEMQPAKDSINLKAIRKEYRNMYQVIDDMAMLTASSQLRSSGRQGSVNTDELVAFGQDNKWQQEILNYSIDYAKTVSAYYQVFMTDFNNSVFTTKTMTKTSAA
jgi:hypothetical protein